MLTYHVFSWNFDNSFEKIASFKNSFDAILFVSALLEAYKKAKTECKITIEHKNQVIGTFIH